MQTRATRQPGRARGDGRPLLLRVATGAFAAALSLSLLDWLFDVM